jgi:hypothetical protein
MTRARQSRPPGVSLLLGLLGASACTASQAREETFAIELRAVEASDAPVSDVRFWADGRDLGVTDEHGILRVQLSGRDGLTLSLTAACPPEYRTAEPQRQLRLQRLRSADPQTDLQLTTRCDASERQLAVVVRTRGAALGGIPIQAAGQLVGQTEADGTAHLLLRSRPHATLRVALDTSRQPDLIPRDPVRTFQLPDQDDVLLVDQWFETPPRPPPPKPRPSKPAPTLTPPIELH